MPNTYFQFKQFLINQEKSGMKVTTDGCLFGAWVANQLKGKNIYSILDIGTGTGLLSLMLAQVTSDTKIDALEINKNAYLEALDNFQKSSWKDRIACIHTSLQEFKSRGKYDVIISNPPFFSNSFKGQKEHKNQAIHSDNLSVSDLIDGIKRNLKTNGESYILYPENEMKLFIDKALSNGIYLNQKVEVRNRKDDSLFRIIGTFSFHQSEIDNLEIVIRNKSGKYTGSFQNLLNDYYL